MFDEQKIQNKTIKITKVEDGMISTGTKKKKITDQDGKNYSFFLHTKEGMKTKTYQQYEDMGLGVGGVARIGYVVESFQTRDGKQAKVNKVISFGEAFDEERAEVEQPSEEFGEEKPAVSPRKLHEATTEDKPDWEAKDRLHAAQTAANFVATIHEGSGKNPLALKGEMNEVYAWLLGKKTGAEAAEDGVSIEDIPFL